MPPSPISSLERLSKKQLIDLVSSLRQNQPKVNVLEALHEGQRRFVFAQDSRGRPARRVCLRSPRRYGKTTAALLFAIDICQRTTWARCVGVYQEIKESREKAWPILQQLAEAYELDVKFNKIELACYFKKTRASIKLAGADDDKRHRQFRGQKNDFVFLDEAQDWYSDLPRLIRENIGPTLMDKRGPLFMMGTPGAMPSGFFYEVCSGQHPEWTTVGGTTFENPHMARQIREEIEEFKELNPNLEDEPWFRREYRGEWVIDSRKNIVNIDPSLNYIYSWQPEHDDQYIISIDWGQDAMAIVVATYNRRRYPWLIYLDAKAYRGMLVHEQATVIKDLMNKYNRYVIVADPGGMARAFKEELERVHGIPIIPAEKKDRMAEIDILISDVSLGTVKIFNRENPGAPEDSGLAKQWRELIWVDSRIRGTREESRPKDIHDAALYARRYAHPYLHQPRDEAPEPGTPQWYSQKAQEIRDKRVRALKRQRRRYR